MDIEILTLEIAIGRKELCHLAFLLEIAISCINETDSLARKLWNFPDKPFPAFPLLFNNEIDEDVFVFNKLSICFIQIYHE